MEARARVSQSSGKGYPFSNDVVTVFVSNIPPIMHWQGLWASFAHHGEVVDSFIPSKRSRAGSRFGFVRFSNMTDAHRAISRLDGFFLMGYRISVSLARFNPRTNLQLRVNKKTKLKHQEAEVFVKSIMSRLTTWGVQRMGGKTYLLTIDDEDLFMLLEDANWSYSRELCLAETSRQLGEREMLGGVNSAEVFIIANQLNGEEKTVVDKKKVVEQFRISPVVLVHNDRAFEGSPSDVEVEDWVSSSEFEDDLRNAERVFFPELESKRFSNKRFGSLMSLQDKVISEAEKKKRDRAIRREKKNSKGCASSELSDRSLTDSDLVYHKEILTKKARKSLALGKRLGIRIEGNEEEAVLFPDFERHGVNSENLIEQRIEIAFPQKTKQKIHWMVEASRWWSDVDFEFSTVKRFGKVSEQVKLWESISAVVVTILSKRVFGGDFSTVKHMEFHKVIVEGDVQIVMNKVSSLAIDRSEISALLVLRLRFAPGLAAGSMAISSEHRLTSEFICL
ncbi:hypothetical protein GQ457_13G010870 [Hibiscus cannabinus]